MQIQTLTNRGRPQRKSRSPVFPHAGKILPFGLYPIFGTLVLPGETVQKVTQKGEFVSMPLKYPLGGAWLERWLVYFKLTDLDPTYSANFMEETPTVVPSTHSTDSSVYFAKSGDYAWLKECTEHFSASYFRDETEPTGEALRKIGGVPQVKMNNDGWYQNLIFNDADEAVPTTDPADFDEAYRKWQIATQMGMTTLSYERYIAEYTGEMNFQKQGQPEILRYGKSWTMPTNIVEPTTGTPTSAWVWKDDFSLKSPKKFKEPGFLVCFATVRPKMYQEHITKSMVGGTSGLYDWFPIYTLDDPAAGIREIDTDDGIFAAGSRVDAGEKTMLYDRRDFLAHGEQFINDFAPPYDLPFSTGMVLDDASTPQDMRGQYCTTTDVAALFSSTQGVFYDGLASVEISGHVEDHTPA